VRALVDEALARSLQILREQRARLERGAARLLERETLVHDDLLALCAEIPQSVTRTRIVEAETVT
jgi:ATP-dependent Zn protease